LPYIQVDKLLVFLFFQKIAGDLTNQYKLAQTQLQQRGVSHYGVAIYIKMYLYGKRRIMETQIFHHAKNILIFKKSSKRNEIILQSYYNSITNLKF
jgi:hypothetical protein